MTQSYSNSTKDGLTKIRAGIVTSNLAANSTEEVDVTHGLGFYPAVKVYFTHSQTDRIIKVISGEITTNSDLVVIEWGDAYLNFSVTPQIIHFNFINNVDSAITMTAYYILYSDQGSL